MDLNRRRFLTASAVATAALATSSGVAAAAPGGQRPGRPVRTGADVLAAQRWRPLAGRRFGVLSNPTGVLANGDHIVDSMVAAGVRPSAAFGPEHGFRGSAQAGESEQDGIDPRTGVPIYDAYRMDAAGLAALFTRLNLDTVVVDVADIGSRFYTYMWFTYTAMVGAARAGVAVMILDRPNPIGGDAAGPMLDPAFASGVGRKPIVQQHGLTLGELAGYFNGEFLPADGGSVEDLTVIEAQGWRRDRVFAETGQRWVPPSPNVPIPDTALVYPGTCLFEGTVFSEGRGTTRPFETIGAPGLDWRWREELVAAELPGVAFRETYFVPTFNKFVGKPCAGVALSVTDPHRLDAIRTAVTMLVTAKRLYPDRFAWRPDLFIDKLFGSTRLRTMVDAGAGVDDIVGTWRTELDQYVARRRQYLLYR